MHNIGEDEIGGRVKKKEKIFKIDRDIQLLMDKGAVSDDKKIASLAKRHAIGEKKIRGWIEKKKEGTDRDQAWGDVGLYEQAFNNLTIQVALWEADGWERKGGTW